MKDTLMTGTSQFQVFHFDDDDIVYVMWEWQPDGGEGDHDTIAELDLVDGDVGRTLLNAGWEWRPGEAQLGETSDGYVGAALPGRMLVHDLWEKATWAYYRALSKVQMANDALRLGYADSPEVASEVRTTTNDPATDELVELRQEGLWDD